MSTHTGASVLNAVTRASVALNAHVVSDSAADATGGRLALPPRQRGVAIMAALFLIVVLAGIGAFAVQIGASQQQTVNLSLLQARAQAAADAGVEWASTRALVNNTCSTATQTFALTEGALQGFTVRITAPNPCFTQHTIAGVPGFRLYTFTATATRGAYGTADFVSRTVTRTVSNAPLPP